MSEQSGDPAGLSGIATLALAPFEKLGSLYIAFAWAILPLAKDVYPSASRETATIRYRRAAFVPATLAAPWLTLAATLAATPPTPSVTLAAPWLTLAATLAATPPTPSVTLAAPWLTLAVTLAVTRPTLAATLAATPPTLAATLAAGCLDVARHDTPIAPIAMRH